MAKLTKQQWIDKGWNATCAEAFEACALDEDSLRCMGFSEIVETVFAWNGVIGYATMFTNVVDNVRNMEAMDFDLGEGAAHCRTQN